MKLGNALNASSFRGGARGFQLEALLKMKETRTAKATSECPTLLHYLARLLIKSDQELVTFINDLPHIEAAARSALFCFTIAIVLGVLTTFCAVSVQNTLASVQTISLGLEQVKREIENVRQRKEQRPEDRFLFVMEVSIFYTLFYSILF